MKKKHVGIIIGVIAAILIVVAFAYVANRKPKSVEDTPEITELSELLNKNIESTYPSTPREVQKLYNRYILYIYGENNGSIDEGQLRVLCDQMRKLYDEELLENNPADAHFLSLQQELFAYQQKKRVMLQANVCDTNDIKMEKIQGEDCARVEVTYFIKEGAQDFMRTYQEFVLRKDASGNWKILGFQKRQGGTS